MRRVCIILYFIFIAVFGSFESYANQNFNKDDSIKINHLLKKARSHGWNNSDSELFYAKQAFDLSIKSKYNEGMLQSYLSITSA